MTVLIVVAMVWLALALASYVVLWFQSERPISETDRRCSWMDHTLRRQYGAGPRWTR